MFLQLALAIAAAVPPAAGNPPAELQELNRRWSGAEATLRRAWPLSERPETGGAWGMFAGFEEGARWYRGYERVILEGRPFYLYWMVAEERAGVGLAGGLPVGTELRVDGWRFTDPAKRRGAFLEMRLLQAPVRVKVGYDLHVGRAKAATSEVEWLGAIERYLRLEVLDLRLASERLIDPLPVISPSATASPRPAGAPRLAIFGVAANPARVAAGGQLEIVLTYEIAGAACAVRERRQIRREGAEVQSFADEIRRETGQHSSAKPLKVPTAAPAGIYEARGRVECGAASAEGSALFEVFR